MGARLREEGWLLTLQSTERVFSNGSESKLSISAQSLGELMRAVLTKGVLFKFEAKGGSMSPFIKNGDMVTVSPLRGASLRLGDIVAFAPPGRKGLTVHRVVDKRQDSTFATRGDNSYGSNGFDPVIPEVDVLGYVTRVDRNGRRVVLGLGPERSLIAMLSLRGMLVPLVSRLHKLLRPFVRISSTD